MITKEREGPEYPAAGKRTIVRLCVVLASAGGAIFVSTASLMKLVSFLVAPEQPFDFVSIVVGLPAFIAVYWGAITHLVLQAIDRRELRHYTLGFIVFSALFAAKDLAPLALMMIRNLLVDGTLGVDDPLGHFSSISWFLVLFHSLVIASGPLIWWLFYRVFSGIRC